MAKKKRYRIINWHSFKFKYRLSVLNENTLEEITNLRVSKINGLLALFGMIVLIFAIAAVIIIYTPLRNYLPGYMNSEVRMYVVKNALKVDSLQMMVERQNWYIMNIQDIFKGNVKADTVTSIDTLTSIRWEALIERSAMEDEFRRMYEETEKYNLTSILEERNTEGLIFHKPTRGLLTAEFDPDNHHYGVDIAARPDESIIATLAGTVIFTAYTVDAGYVIQLQHDKDLITIYKHCGTLLKKEGDKVNAGEAIAIVGNSVLNTSGPHLHFELWHRGQSINPEKYIVF